MPPLEPAQVWTLYGRAVAATAFNILAAAVILIVGLWLASWASSAMRKLSRQHPRVDDTLAAFFSWIVRYSLIAFVLVAVLNRFGVATTSIVAVLGAGALAVGLALQGTLSNLAAGVMLMLFRPYRLGDFVELVGRTGIVRDIDLFTTELTTLQNVKVTLPNGLCWGSAMINYTAHPRRRIDLDFTVAYDTDLNRALEVLNGVLAAETRVLDDPGPRALVKSLGDYAIVIETRAWVATKDYFDARFALIKAGKEALDANRIVIPFPTATSYQVSIDS